MVDDDVTTALAHVDIVVDNVAGNRLFCSVTQAFVAFVAVWRVWRVWLWLWLWWHYDRNSDSWVCV